MARVSFVAVMVVLSGLMLVCWLITFVVLEGNISYFEHKMGFFVGALEPLLATGNRQKLTWSELVTCYGGLISKIILQGTLEGG